MLKSSFLRDSSSKKYLSLLTFFLFILFSLMAACGSPSSNDEKATSEKVAATESTASEEKSAMEASNEKMSTDEPFAEEAFLDAGQEVLPEMAKEALPEPQVEEKAEQVPEKPAQDHHYALVLNSNYVKGSYSVVDLDKKVAIQKDKLGVHSDAVAVVWKELVFVLNRFNKVGTEDQVVIVNHKTLKRLHVIKVGDKANPQDVAVVDKTKAYVSLYGRKDLLIIDPSQGKITGKLDLSQFVEKSTKACKSDKDCKDNYGNGSGKCDVQTSTCQADGLPEMSKMLFHNGKLYVLIQGLDRNQGFKPVQSTMAVFDVATDKLDKTIPLKGKNPTAFIPEPSGTYLINEVGSAFLPNDGGLERFDPKTQKMSGSFVFEEKSIKATFSMDSIVVFSDKVAYLIANDATFKQMLIQFSPSSGQKTKELLKGAKLSGLLLFNQEVWVGDKAAKGLRVFDATNGDEVTQKPILTGQLPPISIQLLP